MIGVGSEHSDVTGGSVLGFALSLTALLVLVGVIVYDLQRSLAGPLPRAVPPAQAVPATQRLVPVLPLPGTPRSPRSGAREQAAIRRQEELLLGTYGGIDRERAVLRVPIKTAMKQLLERSLPTVGSMP